MKLILIIILSFLISNLWGQNIEYFMLSIEVQYLPTCYSDKEIYQKKRKKIAHKFFQIKGKNCDKRKKKKLEISYDIENVILEMDSLFSIDSYQFSVDPDIKYSLKGKTSWKDKDSITDNMIDSFFIRGNIVRLNINDIKINDYSSGINRNDFGIDGTYFKFQLKMVKSNSDTLVYEFAGNLDFGIPNQELKYWIPLYLVLRNKTIFDSIYLEDYFGDKPNSLGQRKIEEVISRFISWRKDN